MVHNSLTVRRFIVTSTLCSQCVPSNGHKANCATPRHSPATVVQMTSDQLPPAAPERCRGCTHMNVSGPKSEVPGPWSRCLRCVSGLFMLTCLLGILWMWSALGSPIRPYRPYSILQTPPSPPALPQHFVLITKSLSERTKLVEESWTNWRCQLNIFHNQLPACYVINAFFFNNIVDYKKYMYRYICVEIYFVYIIIYLLCVWKIESDWVKSGEEDFTLPCWIKVEKSGNQERFAISIKTMLLLRIVF